ncbi:hypothetical protein QTP88_004182 [Uroleucon formosanum]
MVPVSRTVNLALAATAVALVFKTKGKNEKRKWTKDWLLKRSQYSHVNLLNELRFHPEDWHNYLRMDEETYFELLQLVTPLIVKQDTHLRKSITPHERLTATLRFLATGCSYEDLKFTTIISPQLLVTDVVVMLLETPFRRWNSDSKNDLLKMGKPIPILSALAPDKKLSNVFCRSFNPNLYQQHFWLCGSHYIQKLFCWPCLLLGKMKPVWNTVGYYDLKNLSRGIQIHQTSKEHIHNHLGLENLEKNCFTILDVVNEHGNLFKKNYNENVRLNSLFMEHFFDLVLFLGKQELAFRGMSKSIQNDLISCISEFLINQIKNEIKQCKFYSIQIDDTTDISQKTQCSIIIRYVTDKSELIERFLGFHNVGEDRTAQGLFNLVNSVLHEFDIENKLVGQCYDGACVMSGHLTSLQARVKEVAPNALFTYCLAHRLNLVLQHGCSINAKCRIFFANLTGKRIPQFVQTRWSSRSKILHTIVNKLSGFIDVFDCISKDPKSSSESICGAIGHFKNLKTFEFAFLALIFRDIFIYTDNLFNILQNKSFDVEFCLRKINLTYDLINKKRNEPEFLKLFNQAVTLTKPPKATRNESNNQSNFKILFYEIIDNILMQLNTRFQFPNFKTIVKFILCIPGLNANVERIFSNMNNLWTDEKNKMEIKTVKAMLIVKTFFKETCTEFHDFLIGNQSLLKEIYSSNKYYNTP